MSGRRVRRGGAGLLFGVLLALAMMMPVSCSGAGDDFPPSEPPTEEQPDNEEDNKDEEMNMKIVVKVGGREYPATLADNATGRAFAGLLPLTVRMSELNGNEKYWYMQGSLPTEPFTPGTIRTGDLLLYGNDCIVLFYKTFSSSYRYSRIGALDSVDGLPEAVGKGSAEVTFAPAE